MKLVNCVAGLALLCSGPSTTTWGAQNSKITLVAEPKSLTPGEKAKFTLIGAPESTSFKLTVDDKSGVVCDNDVKPQVCTAPKPTAGLAVLGDLEVTATFTVEDKTDTAKTTISLVKRRPADDDRDDFLPTFYVGASVDSFAANETKDYLGYNNPTSAAGQNLQKVSGPQWGYIAGIDFAYRLTHSEKNRRWPWQLWIFGETVHGQRSTEIDCKASSTPEVCSLSEGFSVANPSGAFLSILRNSTSLEGYVGGRLEMFKLNPAGQNSANVYVKSQLGFLTVQGNGADVVDDHTKLATGVIMTNGKLSNSYIDVGWGRTDLFQIHRGRRFKMDGYLEYRLTDSISPFIQLFVNSDFGPGSDDIRAYYGINVNIEELFKTLAKKKDKEQQEPATQPRGGGR